MLRWRIWASRSGLGRRKNRATCHFSWFLSFDVHLQFPTASRMLDKFDASVDGRRETAIPDTKLILKSTPKAWLILRTTVVSLHQSTIPAGSGPESCTELPDFLTQRLCSVCAVLRARRVASPASSMLLWPVFPPPTNPAADYRPTWDGMQLWAGLSLHFQLRFPFHCIHGPRQERRDRTNEHIWTVTVRTRDGARGGLI